MPPALYSNTPAPCARKWAFDDVPLAAEIEEPYVSDLRLESSRVSVVATSDNSA